MGGVCRVERVITSERDLYAAAHGKDGLIIDVRNNGGGSTADRLLGSIMYPRHAYTIPRGRTRLSSLRQRHPVGRRPMRSFCLMGRTSRSGPRRGNPGKLKTDIWR